MSFCHEVIFLLAWNKHLPHMKGRFLLTFSLTGAFEVSVLTNIIRWCRWLCNLVYRAWGGQRLRASTLATLEAQVAHMSSGVSVFHCWWPCAHFWPPVLESRSGLSTSGSLCPWSRVPLSRHRKLHDYLLLFVYEKNILSHISEFYAPHCPGWVSLFCCCGKLELDLVNHNGPRKMNHNGLRFVNHNGPRSLTWWIMTIQHHSSGEPQKSETTDHVMHMGLKCYTSLWWCSLVTDSQNEAETSVIFFVAVLLRSLWLQLARRESDTRPRCSFRKEAVTTRKLCSLLNVKRGQGQDKTWLH